MTTGGSPDKLNDLTPLITEHRPQDTAKCWQCRVLWSRTSNHRGDRGRESLASPDRPTEGATRLDMKEGQTPKKLYGYPENIYETMWLDVDSIVKDIVVDPEEDKVTLGSETSRPPCRIDVPGNRELDPFLPEMTAPSTSVCLQQLLSARTYANYEPKEYEVAHGFGPLPLLFPDDMLDNMEIDR